MPSSITTFISSLIAALGFGGTTEVTYQGYVEASYVLVSPQIGGILENLSISKGDRITKDTPLFTLEREAQQIALDRARSQVRGRKATLDDLTKAKREPEIQALFAQRDQAAAAFDFAGANWNRDKKLIATKAISQAEADRSRTSYESARAKLQEAEAALATGRQSIGRNDAIRAAEASLSIAENDEASALWALEQKQIKAPTEGLVFDTLYKKGEYIPAGQAVISLLPPENIKVRFFVPSPDIEAIKIGQNVTLETTQQKKSTAKIVYVSPTAEYSPPQLFNRDNREKLLYMIEAQPENYEPSLHPGQPIDVSIITDKNNG
ncbi:MAG: HlyD family efflux transporter periplasmic adaptor subunit [Proteobacteria bacterium]|jgi:HlyD family secretion protein|nr:HlyD family efflux transporter periplasmic adaptor subunit [Alphaproteobacteria bacterium]NCC03307.1 HlyD family efflux transporter periplasmic adaptor subunit [Pseudomonadota bacterium]